MQISRLMLELDLYGKGESVREEKRIFFPLHYLHIRHDEHGHANCHSGGGPTLIGTFPACTGF